MTGHAKGTIGVVLVDDHRLLRDGLREILSAEDDIEVVAEGSSAAEAVSLAAKFQSDILLLAAEVSSISPISTIRQITEVSPPTRVVVLSAHSNKYLVPSMAAGAAAYLSKDIGGCELCAEIRLVARDSRMLFAARVPRMAVLDQENPAPAATVLTERETEILRLVGTAMSNSQIATKLYISEATVKRHLTNIFSKLKARSRLDAMNRAIALGILEGFESRPAPRVIGREPIWLRSGLDGSTPLGPSGRSSY